jgi:hypothetical protein
MCQLFISKDFETSLLTLLGVSLVLWRRKADNEHSNPLFYCPSPLNSQHLHFQFTVASLLKIFDRSRRDWEKKCREGSQHRPAVRGTTHTLSKGHSFLAFARQMYAFLKKNLHLDHFVNIKLFFYIFKITFCWCELIWTTSEPGVLAIAALQIS